MSSHFELQSRDDELLRTKLDQARVRLGICAFMGVCFLFTGYADHPLYLLFVVYGLTLLASAYLLRRFSHVETVASLLLDNYFTIAGLHVTGQQGTFLFIFLIQISFGYGLRFGRMYLLLSLLVACTGVLALYLWSPAWRGNVHLAFAYTLGTPFIGLYVYYLVDRVRRAQAESERRAHEIRHLLAFVAHDIRTPLQALSATLAAAGEDTREDQTRVRLRRMEASVKSLARMATDVLGATHSQRRSLPEAATSVWTMRWLLGITQTFRDELAANGTMLEYDLDMNVWPFIALEVLNAERVLLNTLSNAARHAGGGRVRVILRSSSAGADAGRLLITVLNRHSAAASGNTANAAPERDAGSYHGAQLGLEVVKELSQASGGSFDFRREADGSYVSALAFACQRKPEAASSGILLPVVLVSQDADLLGSVRAALSACTSVVAVPTLKQLARDYTALDKCIAALLIDSAALPHPGQGGAEYDALRTLGLYSTIADDAETGRACDGAFNIVSRSSTAQAMQNTVFAQDALRENTSLFDFDTRASTSGLLRGVRILAVDDNGLNRELLAEGLRESGALLTAVDSVAAGRTAVSAQVFDVILVDWNVGADCGRDLITFLATRTVRPSPAIFILSSEAPARIREDVNAMAGVRVIERPAAIPTIVKTLSIVLHGQPTHAPLHSPRSGAQMFDVQLYEEMQHAGTSREVLYELLDRFVREVDTLFHELRGALSDDAEGRLDRQLHAIKSMCQAAGAYEMGELFANLTTHLKSDRRPEADDVMDKVDILWRITCAHVQVFEDQFG